MKFDTRLNIADSFDVFNFVEVEEEEMPFVSDVKLKDSTSLDENITLGSAVSKQLQFTLYNSPIEVFDGQKITLGIRPSNDDDPTDIDADFSEYDLTEEEIINDLFTPDEEIPASDTDFATEDAEEIADYVDEDGEEYDYTLIEDTENLNEPVDEDDPENDVYRTDSEDLDEPFEEAQADEGIDDYTPMGEYYIVDIKKNDNYYIITALDGFILMNGNYTPTVMTDTVENMHLDYVSKLEQLGIDCNLEPEYPDITITWNFSTTFREAAGYFAGLMGGYATFDRNGALDIRQYMKSDFEVNEVDILDLEINTDSNIVIGGMRCDTDITALTNYISTEDADEANCIDFTNPFMTQRQLNYVFSTYYEWLEYTPARLILDWQDGVQAGDLILINEDWILITNQTIDFGAGTSRIDSLGTTATLSDGQITDPMTRKMQRVQTLLADRIEANYADIVNLDAQKADIDFANVNQASIGTEWVQKLLVQGNVVANNGTVYELDAIHFNTNFIEAGSIKADKLILKNSEDGLYYQLNINTSGFDIESLTDEERQALPDSLHADVLMANTITTKHITVQNLEGTNGWINLAEGTFQYMNAYGNGISWDGNELYIRANRLLLESGRDVAETISQMWKDYNVVWTGMYGTGDYDSNTLVGQVYVYRYGEDVTDNFSPYIFSWARKTDYGYETIEEYSKTFHYDQSDTLISDTFVLMFDDELELELADDTGEVIEVIDNDDDGYQTLIGLEGLV